jgi:hypothetical protein
MQGHEDAGHGQRPVIGTPVRRLLQRPRDHAVGQEIFQQALTLQFLSQSSHSPGPDSTRPAGPVSGTASPSPVGTGGMDDGMTSMANWALNKVPGVAKWSRQPSSYQELCSISGTAAPRHATAINTQPARYQRQETGHQASELRKAKGSALYPVLVKEA